MPIEVQSGAGVAFGISNSGSAITITGFATIIWDTAKASHKFKIDSIEDENGFDKALIATNAHVELDITFVPIGATRAAASEVAVFLEPLSKVTLSNFKIDAFNGDYVYVGDESIDLSHKEAKMQLKIRKYDDADQNASLTTTVSG